MTPEGREILEKLLAQGADWLMPDPNDSHAIVEVSFDGENIRYRKIVGSDALIACEALRTDPDAAP